MFTSWRFPAAENFFFFLFSLSFGTILYVLDTRVIGMALAGLEIELLAFFKKRLRQ